MIKTIVIDFDGTICRKQSYGDGLIWQEPNPGAVEVIQKLAKEYKIVVFTTRLNPTLKGDVAWKKEQIEKWLEKHCIPFAEVTNNKPSAMVYIDDRAIRFTNWNDINNYLMQ